MKAAVLSTGTLVEAVGQTGRHPLHLNAPENVWALVDAPRLELAVRSLLDLLLRYGAAGEPVEVAVSRASDGAAVVALWQPRAVLPPEYRPSPLAVHTSCGIASVSTR